MADIQKRLEKAEKYLQKGKQEDALEEYLSILEDDPNNDGVRQSAADISLSLDRNDEAMALLSTLFDRQAAIGDQAKAIANYKKLARRGTPTVDQSFKFATFIEKSDKKAALEGYSTAVTAYLQDGRQAEALAAMKRMVLLDPSAAHHKRLGELAETLGDDKAAAASFLKMSELEPENAAAWLERGFKLDQSNQPLALALGNVLLKKGDTKRAMQILGPAAGAPGADDTGYFKEAYARALLMANKPGDAEPVIWALFEKNPEKLADVDALISKLIEMEDHDKALSLTKKLEQQMTKQNKRREFISLVKDITTKHPPGIEFLEYLVGLYNSANREQDYCETLTGLFQLYYAAGNFVKASDSLDRAAEVDPYQEGHQKRLELLRGKIDQNRYNAIANRFQVVTGGEEGDSESKEKEEFDKEPTVLEDFILQAEIFLQYSMKSKALERLERINKLFPHEEEKNEKLHTLYINAGYTPVYDAADVSARKKTTTTTNLAELGVPRQVGGGGDENSVDNFSRVTEITRNIYRQATVKAVLFTTVNDVGRHYGASRCIAGLCTPGKPPSAALEYCAPGIKQSEVQHIVKLLGAVQTMAVQTGIVSIDDAAGASELKGIKDAIAALGIKSLLVVPLLDPTAEEHVGILLLEQCDHQRAWKPTDAVVLKTIADQMVLAVNNAKLRSLMKNLAVTDEKSGLLKRSSYLDVLLSEAKRALSQNTTTSLLLLHFGKASALVKEMGEAGVENMMQQLGLLVCAQLRQSDVAVRYELSTIAMILPDTTDKNAVHVVEKMRKALNGVKIAGNDRKLTINVGIAEAVMQQQFDPVDIITEVINRAEAALEAARAEGPDVVKALAPQFQGAAVA
jgi:diguanylate cyclase (GGDEF)-like protein